MALFLFVLPSHVQLNPHLKFILEAVDFSSKLGNILNEGNVVLRLLALIS
jgi:hypothetical protein